MPNSTQYIYTVQGTQHPFIMNHDNYYRVSCDKEGVEGDSIISWPENKLVVNLLFGMAVIIPPHPQKGCYRLVKKGDGLSIINVRIVQ